MDIISSKIVIPLVSQGDTISEKGTLIKHLTPSNH